MYWTGSFSHGPVAFVRDCVTSLQLFFFNAGFSMGHLVQCKRRWSKPYIHLYSLVSINWCSDGFLLLTQWQYDEVIDPLQKQLSSRISVAVKLQIGPDSSSSCTSLWRCSMANFTRHRLGSTGLCSVLDPQLPESVCKCWTKLPLELQL